MHEKTLHFTLRANVLNKYNVCRQRLGRLAASSSVCSVLNLLFCTTVTHQSSRCYLRSCAHPLVTAVVRSNTVPDHAGAARPLLPLAVRVRIQHLVYVFCTCRLLTSYWWWRWPPQPCLSMVGAAVRCKQGMPLPPP